MSIHKEGRIIILMVLVVFVVLDLAICEIARCNAIFFIVIGIVELALFSFILFFFRNPSRKVEAIQSAILAPADGKIIAIDEVFETEFLNRKCRKVSIFMSVWNVHVNRYPIGGTIIYTKYHPGKYLIARHPKSSELNEHQTVAIANFSGVEIMIKQIAGIVARRVICYAKLGQQVGQGQDLGFIRFGSRVDLFLPLEAKISIKLKEIVKGNITTIGYLKQ